MYATLHQNSYIYDYQADEKELKHFIKNNIANATTTTKLKIDKNNFIPIYLRWLEIVKPIINVKWDDLRQANILDSDFYLADLFVDDKDTQLIEDDLSIRDNLFVVFQNEGYKIAKENIKQMFDALKLKCRQDMYWKDHENNTRSEIRTRWWENPAKMSYRNISVEPIEQLPDSLLDPESLPTMEYYNSTKPIFF